VKGTYKKFSGNLYVRNDAEARAIIRHHINTASDEMEARDNEDRYGADIVVEEYDPVELTTDFVKYIECEVKQHWGNTDEFPFPELNIPERKAKFADKGAEFWVLNKLMNRALVVQPDSLTSDRLEEVKNRYCPEGELFFKIPLDECQLIRMETLIPEDDA